MIDEESLIKYKDAAVEIAYKKYADSSIRKDWDDCEIKDIDESGIDLRLIDYCGKRCHIDQTMYVTITWREIKEYLNE